MEQWYPTQPVVSQVWSSQADSDETQIGRCSRMASKLNDLLFISHSRGWACMIKIFIIIVIIVFVGRVRSDWYIIIIIIIIIQYSGGRYTSRELPPPKSAPPPPPTRDYPLVIVPREHRRPRRPAYNTIQGGSKLPHLLLKTIFAIFKYRPRATFEPISSCQVLILYKKTGPVKLHKVFQTSTVNLPLPHCSCFPRDLVDDFFF